MAEARLAETAEVRQHRQQQDRQKRSAARFALRCDQTNDEIKEELSRQRNIRRESRKSAKEKDTGILKTDKCDALDNEGIMKEISVDTKESILEELSYALGPSGLDHCICISCDRQHFRTSVHTYSTNNTWMLRSIAARLRNPEVGLHPDLISYYDCTSYHPAFYGLLLSKHGFESVDAPSQEDKLVNAHNAVNFNVCYECDKVLLEPWEKDIPSAHINGEEFPDLSLLPVTSWPNPPHFSIANHFFIGELPLLLQQATWPELLMTGLVSIVAQTRIMRGGQKRMIRSHCILFDSISNGVVTPPCTLLPRKLNKDTLYRIVLAGPFTDKQTERVKKLHTVRNAMVRGLMDFYTKNNVFYLTVSTDETLLNSLPVEQVPDDMIFEAIELKGSDVDDEQADVAGFSGDADRATETDENEYVERCVIFSSSAVSMNSSEDNRVIDRRQGCELVKDSTKISHLEPSVSNTDSSTHNSSQHNSPPHDIPEFNVHTSTKFANAFDPALDAKTYPHLFPYGRGHPGEQNRRVKVSKSQCIRHYCQLRSRRFAQDPYFVMSSFDRMAVSDEL